VQAAASKAAADLATTVATLEAHIQAHQAEVTAAQALLAKAQPALSAQQTASAAIILTAPGSVQKAAIWVNKNWRYLVGAALASIIVYGRFVAHVI
jgi:hypothetical protein